MNTFIPKEYFDYSISKSEIVLDYKKSIKFIEDMKNLNIPITSWEGWIKYWSGEIGLSEFIQGTGSCLQNENEDWNDYVKRANFFAESTVKQEWIR